MTGMNEWFRQKLPRSLTTYFIDHSIKLPSIFTLFKKLYKIWNAQVDEYCQVRNKWTIVTSKSNNCMKQTIKDLETWCGKRSYMNTFLSDVSGPGEHLYI